MDHEFFQLQREIVLVSSISTGPDRWFRGFGWSSSKEPQTWHLTREAYFRDNLRAFKVRKHAIMVKDQDGDG